ncbi:Hypothetical_protein [Hexamita inflata]|uniref:Hypothetical_protein n=1 Tax=Hexamita inflata TaxID=28002 RepID=A0AA86QZ67_9EUKA|nr:Hypothetical protein HINF_LOCUS36913 [Hexamita inflata]CAI9952391.1 Hypothetical protein HINF_LOCUS40036 [Hexamita inflata]CAI9963966.1 Hypothetical protein HINF_LOCUS51611 [Hexamita inflata]
MMNAEKYAKQQQLDKLFAKQKIKQIDYKRLKSINRYSKYTTTNIELNKSINKIQKRENTSILFSKYLGNLWSSQINEPQPIYKYEVEDEEQNEFLQNLTGVYTDLSTVKMLRSAEFSDSDTQQLDITDL